MAWQDPTTIDWTDGLLGAIYYINSVTNNWFSHMLLISLYVISLMGFYRSQDDFGGAMAVAGVIVFIFGLFFFIAGMITWIVFGITIGMMVVGIVALIIDRAIN